MDVVKISDQIIYSFSFYSSEGVEQTKSVWQMDGMIRNVLNEVCAYCVFQHEKTLFSSLLSFFPLHPLSFSNSFIILTMMLFCPLEGHVRIG